MWILHRHIQPSSRVSRWTQDTREKCHQVKWNMATTAPSFPELWCWMMTRKLHCDFTLKLTSDLLDIDCHVMVCKILSLLAYKFLSFGQKHVLWLKVPFDLWLPKSNKFIVESDWKHLPNLRKFLSGVTENIHRYWYIRKWVWMDKMKT